MERDADVETHRLGSVVSKSEKDKLSSLDVSHESDSGIISIQLLEFKTRLLEAVEELHIQRDAETRYEAEVCKLVLEKQDLEWQKESLQSQINKMTSEHSESLHAFKKQFQSHIRAIEGEKGKLQLSAELKDKEIISLKEELKLLQLFKYSLEKKLSELEQKLQVQNQVKDSHLNQLAEVEKRFRTVSKQCTTVRQAHEKLEQNVEESMNLNKKLTTVNKQQESTIAALKKDVERLNRELVKYKVLSTCRPGEENSQFYLKEQEIQELKQRLIGETELNKKLRDENSVERAQKQDLMSSLQHAQRLLQTQTEAVSRTEKQLVTHTKDYQVLKREHEMIQERGKEREERLTQLIEEYKNTTSTLGKEVQMLQTKMNACQEELKSVTLAYDHLQEKHQQLSSREMHRCQVESDSDNKSNSHNPNCDVRVEPSDTNLNLSEDGCVVTEASLVHSPNKREQMRRCEELEDIPDERTAGCREAAKDCYLFRENFEVNVRSKVDQAILVRPASPVLHSMALDRSEMSESVSYVFVTNQTTVKQETSPQTDTPVRDTFRNGCPSGGVRSYADSRLAELSEPETRSVYGVASDPLMSKRRNWPEEQSLGVSDMQEHQTSDKHTPKKSQDGDLKGEEPRTTVPETFKPQSGSPNNSISSTERDVVPEESIADSTLQDKNPVKSEQINVRSSPQQPGLPHETSLLCPVCTSDTPKEQNNQICQLQEDPLSRCESPERQEVLNDVNSQGTTQAKTVPDSELPVIVNPSGSPSSNTVLLTDHLGETPSGDKREGDCAAVLSDRTLKSHQNDDVSQGHHISNAWEAPEQLVKLQLSDTEKQNTDAAPPNHGHNEKIRSSYEPSRSLKGTPDTQLDQSSPSSKDVSQLDKSSNSSASPRPSISEPKLVVPPGFQDLLSSFNMSLFPKAKRGNRAATVMTLPPDTANASNVRPNQKSHRHGEWNAIKQTFPEKEDRLPISFGSAQAGSPAARAVGNGLRQDCTPTPPPRLHGLGKASRPASEANTPTTLEKEDHQWSDIRAQITKIERFLSSEGFRPPKRRRVDYSEVSKS